MVNRRYIDNPRIISEGKAEKSLWRDIVGLHGSTEFDGPRGNLPHSIVMSNHYGTMKEYVESEKILEKIG